MKPLFTFLLFLLIAPSPCFSESKAALAKEAGRLYEEKKYDEALKKYVELNLSFPDDPKIQYNLANTYYQLKNYQAARKSFLATAIKSQDPAFQKKSLFNLGNSNYKQGKLEEAVASYQKVLELDPDDLTAKQNLEFVQEEIKKRNRQKKEKPQKENQQEKKTDQNGGSPEQGNSKNQQGEQKKPNTRKSENNKNDNKLKNEAAEKGNGQKAPSPEKEEEKEGQANASGEADGNKQEKESDNAQSRNGNTRELQMNEEEAERWLNSLKEDGAKILKKQLHRKTGQGKTLERDW